MPTLSRALGALLFNGITTTERDELSANEGLYIFNTTTNQFEISLSGTWFGLALLDVAGNIGSTQHGTINTGDLHTEYARIAAPEELTASWALRAGGSIRTTPGNPPAGEIIIQVKTATGAPTHSASLGTLCYVQPDGDIYINSDGSTTWAQQANSAHNMASHSDDDTYNISTSGTAATGNLTVTGTITIGSAGISEAELEILDGALVTTT